MLDLACGRGRHALAVARLGRRVVAVDRDPQALGELARRAREGSLPIDCVRVDVEAGYGLPFAPARFDTVLVFRFLYRPLAEHIVAALRPGGLLLFETFTIHQKDLRGYLLDPGARGA